MASISPVIAIEGFAFEEGAIAEASFVFSVAVLSSSI